MSERPVGQDRTSALLVIGGGLIVLTGEALFIWGGQFGGGDAIATIGLCLLPGGFCMWGAEAIRLRRNSKPED